MKIICRKPSGTNCNANEKKFPIDPKIFLPLPLVSVKETSETPFEKSARPRKYLSPAGTYPRSLSGLRFWMYVSTSGENCLICWLARFSLVITRSMTSSMVRGLSAGLGASVAAMVPTPLKIRTKIVVATLRIFSLPSVSQTEFNSHASREIHRLALASRRLELDLLRGASRCFIETVAQTTYHSVYLDAAVRQEYHIENHVTFYFQAAPFRGVLRTRLLQDVHSRRGAFGRRFLLRRLRDGLIREAGGLQRAALGAWRRIRRAVTEPRARHRAADSFVAAGAVAVSRPTRQSGRTKTIDVRGFVRITLASDSVGIAETAGLHFVHRSHHRCRSRAACSKIADLHIFFRPLRLARWRIDFHLLENRIEFHGFRIQRLYFGWCDFCREKNVRLFGVQLHRFRLYRLWFRGRNFGFHLRRRWRLWRWWRNRDFRNRLHQLGNP